LSVGAPAEAAPVLLEVDGLVVEFSRGARAVRVVDGVQLRVSAGATVGLVGESGCGKSVTALALLGLVPPPGRIAGGSVRLQGRELVGAPAHELRRVRGDRVAMIFQEPMTALNPVFPVGEQVAEVLRTHRGASRREAAARAVEALREVGIPAPEERAARYPHELSGGMRQRVLVAMALACDPALLVADEPTTALDVTVQAQLLALLRRQQQARGMALLLITHDLGVVAESCEQVVVMYAGRVVERAPAAALFAAPAHPYTAGLLRSLPRGRTVDGPRTPLAAIPGAVPAPGAWPTGCRFRERCPRATPRCAAELPALRPVRAGGEVACHDPEPT